MDINLSIVDQRVKAIAERLGDKLDKDPGRRPAKAFVLLCVQAVMEFDGEEALACLTDGGQDLAIDALHVGDVRDGEFRITLFQGKYATGRKVGRGAFPSGEIEKVIRTVGFLFDPDARYSANPRLEVLVEEVRSLVREGYFPEVRVVLCNNGPRWDANGDAAMALAAFPDDQVLWEHVNHERLVQLLAPQKPISATLQLSGEVVIEPFDFRRVLIGRVSVVELKRLFDTHGMRLLEKNIRRYLGSNRVNRNIRSTLLTPEQRPNFYFFNNGVTLICSQFRHNALRSSNHMVKAEDLQVINGGQTCVSIQRALEGKRPEDFADTYVLVRLYELEEDHRELVRDITYATNSQNPVDLRDLRANDPIQQKLELGLKDLGWEYRRKKGGAKASNTRSTTPEEVAEAVLAVICRKPHLARFQKGQHFGRLYGEIFSERLLPAQVVFAVGVLRVVKSSVSTIMTAGEWEETRQSGLYRFAPYATHFTAMLLGQLFLESAGVSISKLDFPTVHRIFKEISQRTPTQSWALILIPMVRIALLLELLPLKYRDVSLQRLSATFRRTDLLDVLSDLKTKGEDRLATLEQWEAAMGDMETERDEVTGGLGDDSAFRRWRVRHQEFSRGLPDGWRQEYRSMKDLMKHAFLSPEAFADQLAAAAAADAAAKPT